MSCQRCRELERLIEQMTFGFRFILSQDCEDMNDARFAATMCIPRDSLSPPEASGEKP